MIDQQAEIVSSHPLPEADLLSRLHQVQASAPTELELEGIKDKQDEATRRFLNEEVSLKDFGRW